jgi:hypothetical protein
VALGQVFLRVLLVFPCRYHSTVALQVRISPGVCPYYCCSILDYLTNGFQTACVMQSQMVRSVNYGSKIIWMKAIVAYFKIHSLNFSGETEEN